MIHFTSNRQTTRQVVRGSRLFKELCGYTRPEKNSARSLDAIQSGSPVRSRAAYFVEHLRRRVAVDQEAVHKAGFEDSLSGPQFAASAAKQDHLMFS